uniref:Reverse transcriptase domain-containing protein n=1 Tax=Nicotiana tabacum TaxID=4097 RepID=A0A1S4ARJ9_TOBAC|nr:PREDICTED: uncharacterized protein LOC107800621 [Nicotiana tabacum]
MTEYKMSLSIFSLLGTSVAELPSININIAKDGPCLTRVQQLELIKHVTSEEITQVLKDLPNDKAPGIDDFTAEFFKEYWSIIGDDITHAVVQFFETCRLLKETNSTTRTLVSKVGSSQSDFIAGWNILDNVIVAHELVKGYSQKGKFINLIMECISTVNYSILINGGLTPKFKGKKGLRQGDPMPPTCLCWADEISIRLMFQAFNHFSDASGLKANQEKSSLYITGVSSTEGADFI